jgi:hypothetical protein
MTMPFWIRIKARPEFCGPVSGGTVEPIKVLRDALNRNVTRAPLPASLLTPPPASSARGQSRSSGSTI